VGPEAAAGTGAAVASGYAAAALTGAGGATLGLGCAVERAGDWTAATETRGAAPAAGGIGAAAEAPPGRQAVGALASLDAAAVVSCGEVTDRGRDASCPAAGVGAREGAEAGPVEVGAVRWPPMAPLARTTWGAEPGEPTDRTTGAAAGAGAWKRVA
jgi:hypothetical protein